MINAALRFRRKYMGDTIDLSPLFTPSDSTTGTFWDWLLGTNDGTFGQAGGSNFNDFLTNATTGQLSLHQQSLLQADAANQMSMAGGSAAQANAAAQSITNYLASQNAVATNPNLTLWALGGVGVLALILFVKR